MKYLLIFESFKEVEKLDLASQIFICWRIKKNISKQNLFKGSVSDSSREYVFFYKKRWRGYFSVFFAKAKNAGIIDYKKVGKSTHLVKGENFDTIKKGIKSL